MKKNILLVQSFFILPLLTSSFVFTMEEKPSYAAAAKGTHFPLKNSGSYKQNKRKKQLAPQVVKLVIEETITTPAPAIEQLNVTVAAAPVIIEEIVETPIPTVEQFDAIIADTPVFAEYTAETPTPATEQIDTIIAAIAPVIAEETTVIELSLPKKIAQDKGELSVGVETTVAEKPSVIPAENVVRERMAHVFAAIQEITAKNIENTPEALPSVDPLAASVYQPAPAIKQGLGWGEWAKSKLSTTWFAIDAIKSKTFDPENADHMSSLNAAAEKLVLNGDSAGLQDLLRACRSNYSQIKLDKSVALQIQKRFQLDESATKEEYIEQIISEDQRLIKAQERIFAQNALLIQNVAAQLESSNMELAKAQVAYMVATNSIMENQNKKLNDTHQGTTNLSKLYRKLDTTKDLDSPYLRTLKNTHFVQENMYQSMQTLDKTTATLKDALAFIAPEKSTVLQLTDK